MTVEDILRTLLSKPDASARRRYLGSLDEDLRDRAASQLFCHIDLHIAEGHRTAADTVLQAAEDVSAVFESELFPYLCCRRRANLCRKWGDTVGAIEAYRRAWRILEESDLHAAQVEVLMELGILYDITGDHRHALTQFRKAAEICRRERLEFNWAAALFNMASIYLEMGEQERFERNARKVERLDKTFDFPSHRARLELLRANSEDRNGNADKSVEHYRRALDAYRQVHDRLKASEILAHLGEVARLCGQDDMTGPLLGEALAERRALDAREAEGRFYYYRGVTAWQAGLPEEAATHYQRALERFNGLSTDAELETRYRLYQCLRALGQTQESLPAYLEGKAAAEDTEAELWPQDPHIGRPHPPLKYACDANGRPEAYRTARSDGAALADFHRRRKARGYHVDRAHIANLLNALAAWMKHEGRKDVARVLRREAKAVEAWLRRVSPSAGRRASGLNN